MFRLGHSPPAEPGGIVARITPLSIFRENLLALVAPFFNVVVRWAEVVDAPKILNLFFFVLAADLVATHNSVLGFLCTKDVGRLTAHVH